MSKSHARDSHGNFLCGCKNESDHLSRTWHGVDCDECLELKPSMGTVINKVMAYLAPNERRDSSGGDYASVKEGDVHALWDIIREILYVKFEEDCDGDIPIEVDIVNRNECYSKHYEAVPYSHKAETEDDRMRILRIVQLNASIANRDLDKYVSEIIHRHRDRKEDVERGA